MGQLTVRGSVHCHHTVWMERGTHEGSTVEWVARDTQLWLKKNDFVTVSLPLKISLYNQRREQRTRPTPVGSAGQRSALTILSRKSSD